VKACDRCLCAGDVGEVIGRELCDRCAESFTHWWNKGARHLRRPRAKRGAPWRTVVALIHEHGHVTPELYAARTGLTEGRQAYYALRYFVRQGKLEADILGDGSLAFFSTDRAEAAQ
jgi:hypothetical protein